jgi:hypothetical protein
MIHGVLLVSLAVHGSCVKKGATLTGTGLHSTTIHAVTQCHAVQAGGTRTIRGRDAVPYSVSAIQCRQVGHVPFEESVAEPLAPLKAPDPLEVAPLSRACTRAAGAVGFFAVATLDAAVDVYKQRLADFSSRLSGDHYNGLIMVDHASCVEAVGARRMAPECQ